MKVRHFLTLGELTPQQAEAIIERALALKKEQAAGHHAPLLSGKVLAMIFEKSSTRTRVSFETAMAQLGGHAIYLSPSGTQLGRGEPLEDTARVLSRMVDIIMVRTFAHDQLERFAQFSSVPVINGLTDSFHPCQLLADIQTYREHRGPIRGRTVAWLGDGNNVCQSYINAAVLFGFHLRIACPEGYAPDPALVKMAGTSVDISADPEYAVAGADLVVTDVWASMGQEQESDARLTAFRPFQVNAGIMQKADPEALFMHCLPAHRGEEVTAEVIDGAQSVVWDEAGNRLHAQKALLEFLLADDC